MSIMIDELQNRRTQLFADIAARRQSANDHRRAAIDDDDFADQLQLVLDDYSAAVSTLS